MPSGSLLTILECLESTQPVHINDTLASHREYIGLLEGLLSKLLKYEHTWEEICYDLYVRRLYTTMAFSLGRAYVIARESSPMANCYGFDVEPCGNYWKMKQAGIDAGIL